MCKISKMEIIDIVMQSRINTVLRVILPWNIFYSLVHYEFSSYNIVIKRNMYF